MNNLSLSPRLVGLIIGALVLVIALGADCYLYSQSLAVPAVSVPPPVSYPVAKVQKEFASGGVFSKVLSLQDIPASQPSVLTSTQSDLGRDDSSF